MDAQEIMERLREDPGLLREFSIEALYLFGSVVRGEEGAHSDLDVLVEFDPSARIGLFAFARLKRRLSGLLGMPVDLVTADALHESMRERIMEEAVRAA